MSVKTTDVDQTRVAVAAHAADLVDQGFCCTEAVLMAVGPHVARDWHPSCVTMATGFRGGIGRTRQEVCGALVGAVMVLGTRFGRTSVVDDAVVQDLTARLQARFLATYGTTHCGTIRETLIEVNGEPGACAPLVGRTTEMLLEILAEAGVVLGGQA